MQIYRAKTPIPEKEDEEDPVAADNDAIEKTSIASDDENKECKPEGESEKEEIKPEVSISDVTTPQSSTDQEAKEEMKEERKEEMKDEEEKKQETPSQPPQDNNKSKENNKKSPRKPNEEYIKKSREVYTKIYELHKKTFDKQEFDFVWKQTLEVYRIPGSLPVTVHSPGFRKLFGGPQKKQLVNHFPNIGGLVTKVGILKSLESFYSKRGERVFVNTPETFHIKKASYVQTNKDTEWTLFVNRYNELSISDYTKELLPAKFCGKNIWIVKPTGLNCGRGIMVFDKIDPIKKFINSCGKGTEFVIQKYIEKPLLLWGRKFDIRIWCVVTDKFDVYLYHEGYLRTSSELFTLDIDNEADEEKQMVHLTNYCMQVKSENIGKFEEGNTMSFDQFQEYINENYPDKHVDVFKDMVPRMKDLVLDSILAVQSELNNGNKGRNCFELYGYDFMVDEDFRIWLIEVNTNPFLGVQNPWHQSLLDHMADDLVDLVIEPLFPKPEGYEEYHKELPNWWEMIYTLNADKKKDIINYEYTTRRTVNWLYPSGIPGDLNKKKWDKIMQPMSREEVKKEAEERKLEMSKPPKQQKLLLLIKHSPRNRNNNNNNYSSETYENNNNNNNENNKCDDDNDDNDDDDDDILRKPSDDLPPPIKLPSHPKSDHQNHNHHHHNNNNNENSNNNGNIKTYPGRSLLRKKWLSSEPDSPRQRCQWWISELTDALSDKKKQLIQRNAKLSNESISSHSMLPTIINNDFISPRNDITLEEKGRHCCDTIVNICGHSHLWLYAARNNAFSVLWDTINPLGDPILGPSTRKLSMAAIEALIKQINQETRPRTDLQMPPVDDIIEYIIKNIGKFRFPDLISEDSAKPETDMDHDIRILAMKLLLISTNIARVNGKIGDPQYSRFILPFYLYASQRSTGFEKDICTAGLKFFSTVQLRTFYNYLNSEIFDNYDIYDVLKTQPICEAILTKLTHEIEHRDIAKQKNSNNNNNNNLVEDKIERDPVNRLTTYTKPTMGKVLKDKITQERIRKIEEDRKKAIASRTMSYAERVYTNKLKIAQTGGIPDDHSERVTHLKRAKKVQTRGMAVRKGREVSEMNEEKLRKYQEEMDRGVMNSSPATASAATIRISPITSSPVQFNPEPPNVLA